jgi:hypothetical protein
MLTLFSTPKPFVGHIGVIQRNALRSWKLLHPDVEIILFGDDLGAGEAAQELGIRHEPEVREGEHGTKYQDRVLPHLDYLFERAQQVARHDLLCYVNCDILLTDRFLASVAISSHGGVPFLMVGRRWDIDITDPLDFSHEHWQDQLMASVAERGRSRPPWYIDYFVFKRGLYQNLLPLVIGRVIWDNWLIWKASSVGAIVVDASPFFRAVHQNHDYSHHPQGEKGIWNDSLAARNRDLAGQRTGDPVWTIENATHEIMTSGKLRRKGFRDDFKRVFKRGFDVLVHRTFGLRNSLGIRRTGWLGTILRRQVLRGGQPRSSNKGKQDAF